MYHVRYKIIPVHAPCQIQDRTSTCTMSDTRSYQYMHHVRYKIMPVHAPCQIQDHASTCTMHHVRHKIIPVHAPCQIQDHTSTCTMSDTNIPRTSKHHNLTITYPQQVLKLILSSKLKMSHKDIHKHSLAVVPMNTEETPKTSTWMQIITISTSCTQKTIWTT